MVVEYFKSHVEGSVWVRPTLEGVHIDSIGDMRNKVLMTSFTLEVI